MSNPKANIDMSNPETKRYLTEEESSSAERVEQVLRNEEDTFFREIVGWGVEISEDNPAEGVNYCTWRDRTDDTNLPDTSELKVDLFTDDEKATSAVKAALVGRTGIPYGAAIIGKKRQIILISRPGSALPGPGTAATTPTPTKIIPIGQTIDGVKITHYGYPGDAYPDSQSMAGIGDRGNHLTPSLSVALTKSQRRKLFGVEHSSTGKQFTFSGVQFQDDDTAPESDDRIDVYDPFYQGRDSGCADKMYAKSRAEMVKAGILPS
jgi:hypothetical protein